jgi:VanZ family protein
LTPVRRISLWLPVIAWIAVLYRLSSRGELPGAGLVWDKLAHFVAYALLGVLCLRACHGGLGPLRLGPVVLAMALSLAHGAVDEWHQSRVPGREASVRDWIADAAGAAAALALVGGLAWLGPASGAAPDPRRLSEE